MDESGDLGVTGRLERGPGTADGDAIVLFTGCVDVGLGGQVEEHLAADHRVLPGGGVGQFAPHRLGAQGGHLGRGCVAADQGPDGVPFADQASDQRLPDEARATGYECDCHAGLQRTQPASPSLDTTYRSNRCDRICEWLLFGRWNASWP